jgi:transcriptional regulator with XRE-family HTH domain
MYEAGKCLLLRRLYEQKMSQQDLADKINMKASQINDYIHNRKKMSLNNAKTISKAVYCSIDDLYEWHQVRR